MLQVADFYTDYPYSKTPRTSSIKLKTEQRSYTTSNVKRSLPAEKNDSNRNSDLPRCVKCTGWKW